MKAEFSELSKRLLQEDVNQGNAGMVLEHAADSDLTDVELKEMLVNALRNRASQKDEEARQVDASWGQIGKGRFEKTRADNLRKLADRFDQLFKKVIPPAGE
ncbi:hypothetical protein A2363_01130 [Candidatus Gottesmanbacteria bacterium RIFOXYB1_FULL_47_11]|uniref:Uncharacterized protein n=1 Tax=Candidatus Gottesmanbacteria bacterium RIFOXYB1_FULL_47_11 TaxID=1798401 RepID=A0A1F6BDS9_9BACT|nr:MAG: hypothetical protein A2363_01130 [Candidatus Gottesmanbacteria bacterium RIFOXYB1_FULL_47_11]